MKSVLLLLLIFSMILPLSAYATESKISINSVTSEHTVNPFQIKHENGTILFAIYRDGVLSAGTIPKERIQSSGTWSVSDIPTLPQSLITDLISTLSGKQAVVTGISDAEIGWLDGVTSAIQTQLNGKQASGNYLTSPISESDVANLVSDLSAKESVSSHNADNSTITTALNSKESITSHDSDISTLDSAIALKESISSHNADNSTITTALNSKESITSHDSDVSILNSAIALKESISSHNVDNSTITTALNSKQDIVSGVDNTEIGYLNGLSSSIQNQLDSKQATISGLTSSGAELNILDGATLSTIELNYVDGVISDIQSQINGKQSSLGFTPENIANKNASNGYAGLNNNGLISSYNLGSGSNSSSTYLRGDRTWTEISGSGISEINTIEGGNARITNQNSTSEVILKHFLDSVTIAWTNGTSSISGGIVSGSIDDAELGIGIDTTQLASGGVTSTEFDFLADVTSLIQAQLNAKYSASNRQSSIVNSEISTVDTSKITTGTMSTARLGSGTADSTTFLRGDNTWAVPSGGGGSSGITTLANDVTCAVTATYCTVWTIPLTASSGNRLVINMIGDSNTAGSAIQMRVQFDNSGNTGYCLYRTYTTATAEVLDTLLATATTDTGETVWLAGANIPMPLNINCGFETDSSPGNALVQIQMEVASTGTIQKGSNYIKTP